MSISDYVAVIAKAQSERDAALARVLNAARHLGIIDD